MFEGRIYRAAFVPLAIVLAVAAFSLTARPGPATSSLAPDAFEGQKAFAELHQLAAEFPNRRPGSAADAKLARRVASTIKGLGAGAARGGFSVHVAEVSAQTIDGKRTLQTVIARRPGSTGESPIVILAHRDAARRGSAAQLSGTAVLLELARVFAARQTRRTIVLVSTSGGSGGDAGARAFAAQAAGAPGGVDAAIVLGDVASEDVRQPVVVPYSDGYGSSSDGLQRTLDAAISHEAGVRPGSPSVIAQLAHLALPLAAGEQGALAAAGLPSVLVQVSGERGPAPNAPVSLGRVEGFGRAVLSAVDALDAAPNVSAAPQTGLVLSRRVVPGWALRLLILALLLPPAAVLIDALARARRRQEPLGRWAVWACTCALPFLACALFAILMGAAGVLAAAPLEPALAGAMPFGVAAAAAVLACALVLGLAWLAWPVLLRRLNLATRPRPGVAGSEIAGVATLLVLLALAFVVWAIDPYAALLIAPGLHLLLLVASPERRPRPLACLGLIALALVPLGLLIAFYANQFGYGPGALVHGAMLAFAGGHLGVGAAVLWSVALGCATAIVLVALTVPADPLVLDLDEHSRISIRGPLTYAGPGSLGGTESALRR